MLGANIEGNQMNLSPKIAVFIFLIVFPPLANSATLQVPIEYPTIQAGIEAAAVGDTVLLESGIYFGDGNRDIDFLGKDITVRSVGNDPSICTIVCQGTSEYPHRGFIFQSGESSQARLEGVTISGGWSPYSSNSEGGGAILCKNGSSPIIKNCRLAHCISEGYGGGLSAFHAGPTLIDCQIDNNISFLYGGGVSAQGEFPFTMSGCLVRNNSCDYDGGGVFLADGSSYLYECTIADNSGAGIYSYFNSFLSLIYSTVIGNYKGVEAYGDIVVENSLLAFNVWSFFDTGFTVELSCCNVFGHEADDYGTPINGMEGINGNISADPLLCDPGNWDYHVAPDSPCLDDLCGQIGAFGAGECGAVTPVDDQPLQAFGLRGNYPNPFNPSTIISYDLDQDASVMLQVFDITGKLVRTLVDESTQSAGRHDATWNGRDNSGHQVAAGVFLYVLTTPSGRDSGRMALIK